VNGDFHGERVGVDQGSEGVVIREGHEVHLVEAARGFLRPGVDVVVEPRWAVAVVVGGSQGVDVFNQAAAEADLRAATPTEFGSCNMTSLGVI
jgi:hypothetical protein